MEEALLLEEETEPQGEKVTALHSHIHPEEASEPEGAISSGVIVDMQRQLPLTPPRCAESLPIESGPPPLRGLARPNLFRVYADDHHPEHLDGGVAISL